MFLISSRSDGTHSLLTHFSKPDVFNQLSFWRHPFTAETFLQTWCFYQLSFWRHPLTPVMQRCISPGLWRWAWRTHVSAVICSRSTPLCSSQGLLFHSGLTLLVSWRSEMQEAPPTAVKPRPRGEPVFVLLSGLICQSRCNREKRAPPPPSLSHKCLHSRVLQTNNNFIHIDIITKLNTNNKLNAYC